MQGAGSRSAAATSTPAGTSARRRIPLHCRTSSSSPSRAASSTACSPSALVLVYRSTRIVNFAHGEVGALGAAVLGRLVLDEHWSFWLALPVVVAGGAALSALVEVTVVQRLASSPRVVLLVATIGVSEVLPARAAAPAHGPCRRPVPDAAARQDPRREHPAEQPRHPAAGRGAARCRRPDALPATDADRSRDARRRREPGRRRARRHLEPPRQHHRGGPWPAAPRSSRRCCCCRSTGSRSPPPTRRSARRCCSKRSLLR